MAWLEVADQFCKYLKDGKCSVTGERIDNPYDKCVNPLPKCKCINLTKNNISNRVAIHSYNSESNMYTFPTDGYVQIYSYSGSVQADIYGADANTSNSKVFSFNVKANSSLTDGINSLFVRKGMKCVITGANGSSSTGYFFGLE